jgi:diguanylate cyclase (GGDEF)-like protein/PAS domain S-box-containing protein
VLSPIALTPALTAGWLPWATLGLAIALVALMIERRRSASAQGRTDRQMEAMYRQTGAGIALIAPDGRFLNVNARLCEMVGYGEGELQRMRISELTHPEDRAVSDETRLRLLAGPASAPVPVVERRYLHRNGTTVWALLSAAVVRDGAGNAEGVMGIVLDVTELRRAQQELEWKTALLATQQEASLDAILLVDEAGRIRSFNQRFVELWGIPQEAVEAGDDEPVLRSVVGQVKDPEGFLREVERLYRQPDEKSHHELEMVDGRTIERYSSPVIGPDRSFKGRIWFFRDVTDRKRSESRLRESEARFRQMAETVGEVFWLSSDHASTMLYVSPAFEPIWGRRCDELYANPSLWLQAVDPAHVRLVTAALQSLAEGIPYDIEYRITRPDGTERWIHDRGYPMRDEAGRVVLTSGVASDVTKRKQDENAMRLSALAFESIADGVMVTDADQRIVSVNHAFTAITGYEQAEVVGHSPRFLQSGRHDASFYAAMWRKIRTVGHWRGEVWDRRRSGEVYPELLSISAVRDAAGAITHYVGVSTEISSLKEYEARLQHQAHHDMLTGLPNRVLFQVRFDEALARAKRHQQTLAVVLLDLDHFKTINDSLGHAAGDQLLEAVAARLGARVRETDTVARLGGDEFALLLDDTKSPQAAAVVGRALIDALAAPFQLAGHQLYVTASLGVACYPQDGSDQESLLKNADTAMYRAKAEGRNNCQFFSQEMNERALETLVLGNSLRLALARDELFVHYQPQYALASGRTTGVEALVRWRHPEHGLVPPSRFIPLAEESGLIEPIGEWVLRTACRQMRSWQDAGLPLERIAVNLSARQFRHPDLLQHIADVLAETGLAARHLELEVTESMVMQHAEDAAAVLAQLKATGITIAVDDFGTGYSSLSYLKRLPIDILKIDQSFVRGVPQGTDDVAIIRAIIAMAKSLKLRLIAEGIENADQRAFLEREGCEEGQGYLFGRPAPAEAIEQLLGAAPATP